MKVESVLASALPLGLLLQLRAAPFSASAPRMGERKAGAGRDLPLHPTSPWPWEIVSPCLCHTWDWEGQSCGFSLPFSLQFLVHRNDFFPSIAIYMDLESVDNSSECHFTVYTFWLFIFFKKPNQTVHRTPAPRWRLTVPSHLSNSSSSPSSPCAPCTVHRAPPVSMPIPVRESEEATWFSLLSYVKTKR